MNEQDQKAISVLIAYIGVVSIAIIGLVLKGWVLAIMWGWFVVPIFGSPQLSIPAAIGIVFMTCLMVMHFNLAQADLPPIQRIMKVIMEPLVVLVLGWVVHLFV